MGAAVLLYCYRSESDVPKFEDCLFFNLTELGASEWKGSWPAWELLSRLSAIDGGKG